MLFCKGNQTCSECHKLKEELSALKAETEQIKLKHNEEMKTLIAEKPKREAEFREANGKPDRVRENELEQAIEKEREEKREIESRLRREKNTVEKESDSHKKRLAEAQCKNGRLLKDNEDYLKKIKRLEKGNEECDTSEYDELKAKLNRLSTELDQLHKKIENLKKQNVDYFQKIKDLEKNIITLETKNGNLLSKIKTDECEASECDKVKAELNRISSEIERLRKEDNILKKENVDSLQKIKDLETKNNSLESKIKTKEYEKEQLHMEYNDSIAKANGDSLPKIADLEKKIKTLEKKNEKLRKKLEIKECKNCKMVDEEVNKDKNAVNRKY